MYCTDSNVYSADSCDLSGARRCQAVSPYLYLDCTVTQSYPTQHTRPILRSLYTSMQVHIAAGKFRLLPGESSLAHEDLSGASISLAWQCLFYGPTIECEISDSPADSLLERFLPCGRWKLAGVEKHDELKCADALYLLYKRM